MSSAFEQGGDAMIEARPKITVSDLTLAYGGAVVMQDLNFTVNERDIFIIMGGSGSGKSTLLRHLIGLREPARGIISYQGTGAGFWEMPPPERERLLRSEEHTSELQSRVDLVCRLLLEKKKKNRLMLMARQKKKII